MTKAVILSAGQGSRLFPLTADKPKCLIEIQGQTILARQVITLADCGVNEIVVVTGFMDELVQEHLDALARPGLTLRTIFNPFYKAADNLASCWMAREEFKGDCLLINGDTIFSYPIARKLLATPEHPVTITIDEKGYWDDDDMKVELDGDYLKDIGKTLPLDIVTGEAIGMIRFQKTGGEKFASILDANMHQQTGLKKWYLSAIAEMAPLKLIKWCTIKGMPWGELDDHDDYEVAKNLLLDPAFSLAEAAE
jgi:choline kinase